MTPYNTPDKFQYIDFGNLILFEDEFTNTQVNEIPITAVERLLRCLLDGYIFYNFGHHAYTVNMSTFALLEQQENSIIAHNAELYNADPSDALAAELRISYGYKIPPQQPIADAAAASAATIGSISAITTNRITTNTTLRHTAALPERTTSTSTSSETHFNPSSQQSRSSTQQPLSEEWDRLQIGMNSVNQSRMRDKDASVRGRKRERNEIVLAYTHNGVSIYDIAVRIIMYLRALSYNEIDALMKKWKCMGDAAKKRPSKAKNNRDKRRKKNDEEDEEEEITTVLLDKSKWQQQLRLRTVVPAYHRVTEGMLWLTDAHTLSLRQRIITGFGIAAGVKFDDEIIEAIAQSLVNSYVEGHVRQVGAYGETNNIPRSLLDALTVAVLIFKLMFLYAETPICLYALGSGFNEESRAYLLIFDILQRHSKIQLVKNKLQQFKVHSVDFNHTCVVESRRHHEAILGRELAGKMVIQEQNLLNIETMSPGFFSGSSSDPSAVETFGIIAIATIAMSYEVGIGAILLGVRSFKLQYFIVDEETYQYVVEAFDIHGHDFAEATGICFTALRSYIGPDFMHEDVHMRAQCMRGECFAVEKNDQRRKDLKVINMFKLRNHGFSKLCCMTADHTYHKAVFPTIPPSSQNSLSSQQSAHSPSQSLAPITIQQEQQATALIILDWFNQKHLKQLDNATIETSIPRSASLHDAAEITCSIGENYKDHFNTLSQLKLIVLNRNAFCISPNECTVTAAKYYANHLFAKHCSKTMEDLLPMEIANINVVTSHRSSNIAPPNKKRTARLHIDYKAYFYVEGLWVNVSTAALYKIKNNKSYFSPTHGAKYTDDVVYQAKAPKKNRSSRSTKDRDRDGEVEEDNQLQLDGESSTSESSSNEDDDQEYIVSTQYSTGLESSENNESEKSDG